MSKITLLIVDKMNELTKHGQIARALIKPELKNPFKWIVRLREKDHRVLGESCIKTELIILATNFPDCVIMIYNSNAKAILGMLQKTKHQIEKCYVK